MRLGFDPWVGKIPGGGHGSPLQYSCLENPMDRGAWWSQRVRHDLATKQQQGILSGTEVEATLPPMGYWPMSGDI